jgi:hypothetical protein
MAAGKRVQRLTRRSPECDAARRPAALIHSLNTSQLTYLLCGRRLRFGMLTQPVGAILASVGAQQGDT